MVLFFPIQQELDCLNSNGQILGKIKFDGAQDQFVFVPDNDSVVLSGSEQTAINARLAGLASGQYDIDMQDDD